MFERFSISSSKVVFWHQQDAKASTISTTGATETTIENQLGLNSSTISTVKSLPSTALPTLPDFDEIASPASTDMIPEDNENSLQTPLDKSYSEDASSDVNIQNMPSVPTKHVMRDLFSSWRQNCKDLYTLAAPTLVTYFCWTFQGIITLAFLGQLSSSSSSPEAENFLSGAALGLTFVNITGNAIALGFAYAADTLGTQAVGSGSYRSLCLACLRSLFLEFLLCIPVAIWWIFSGDFLKLIGQEAEVSELAGDYCQVCIAGLFPLLISEMCTKYLCAQEITMPSMIAGLVANAANALFAYLFLFVFELGFLGSPLAVATSFWCQCIFLLSYIFVYKRKQLIAEGKLFSFSLSDVIVWEELKTIWRLGLPGWGMLVLEWGSFEACILAAGWISTESLDTFVIVTNLMYINFPFAFSLGQGACILVGHALGENNARLAKQIIAVAFVSVYIIEAAVLLLMYFLAAQLASVFTSDSEIIDKTVDVMWAVVAICVFDSTQGFCAGITRGTGRQRTGAWINLIAFYVLGLPGGITLALITNMGIWGLFLGEFVAVVTCSAGHLYHLFGHVSWEKEARKAFKTGQEIEMQQIRRETQINLNKQKPKDLQAPV